MACHSGMENPIKDDKMFQYYMRLGLVDINGYLVEKPRNEYRYSFDPYAIYRHPDFFKKENHVIYGDRLYYSQNYESCVEKLKEKYANIDFQNPAIAQEFISLMLGYDVILSGIELEANKVSGFEITIYYIQNKD